MALFKVSWYVEISDIAVGGGKRSLVITQSDNSSIIFLQQTSEDRTGKYNKKWIDIELY